MVRIKVQRRERKFNFTPLYYIFQFLNYYLVVHTNEKITKKTVSKYLCLSLIGACFIFFVKEYEGIEFFSP